MNTSTALSFELCFRPLCDVGRAYAFPCDAQGRVDLDRLSERTRVNYFFARSLVGRDVSAPAVRPITVH